MSLKFVCVKCGSEIVVKYLKTGENARCPHCGHMNNVPSDAASTDKIPEYMETPEVNKRGHESPGDEFNIRGIWLKVTAMSTETRLKLLGIAIWLMFFAFIIYLFNFNLVVTPLWKYRLIIYYGFMVVGGMAWGLMENTWKYSMIIIIFTLILSVFTSYIWNIGNASSFYSWRMLACIPGYGIGKMIIYIVRKRKK